MACVVASECILCGTSSLFLSCCVLLCSSNCFKFSSRYQFTRLLILSVLLFYATLASRLCYMYSYLYVMYVRVELLYTRECQHDAVTRQQTQRCSCIRQALAARPEWREAGKLRIGTTRVSTEVGRCRKWVAFIYPRISKCRFRASLVTTTKTWYG